MMRNLVLGLVVISMSACCPPGSDQCGGDGGKNKDGGTSDGGVFEAFQVVDLDPSATEATFFAVAIDPAKARVGVAYFDPRGTETHVGQPDYNLKYVEWNQGSISPIETIRFLQRRVGLSLAFHPITGEPVVAYLGGAAEFVPGESIYWFQSDAVYATRNSGVWTEAVVATTGANVTCGNGVSDRGLLVGLWPSVAFDSTGKLYFAYRDGHDAQFPQQDWNGSDVELFEGQPTSLTGRCINAGGNNKQAWGGRIQLAMGAGDQPAMVYDQSFGTADGIGSNVIFQKRDVSGNWSSAALILSIANTQSGASLAYDATEGYGVAAVDRSTGILHYTNSTNGVQWSESSQVFGAGTGGWWPSLAMDPVYHEPAIAFHICSQKNGVNETQCLTTEDELVVRQRIGSTWREVSVDKRGGYTPKIAFLSSGKRVVVYRQPMAIDQSTGKVISGVGALRLAVEK